MVRHLTLLCAALVLLAGCDSGLAEAERAFENAAFFGASTAPTAGGEWRVNPRLVTRIQVLGTPGPNPVSRDDIFILQVVTDGPGDLVLRRRNAAGDQIFVERFLSSGGGIRSVSVRGSELTDGITGLTRVLVLDGLGRVVTFGDVLVTD